MAITRRQFIRRTGIATAGTLLGPSLFAHPLVRQAFATTNRYFIVLFLDGGNDGLNTVTPITGSLRPAYEAARGTGNGGLRLFPPNNGSDISNLLALNNAGEVDPASGGQIGIHPGFFGLSDTITTPGDPGYGGLKSLYDAGMVAVIQGCGYPSYNLSHDESRRIWQTANPLNVNGYSSTGWVGRYLASQFGGSAIPAINIEDSIAPEFRQFTTSVLAINRLSNFDFPRDNQYGSDFTAKDNAFNALYGNASGTGQLPLKLIGDSGAATYTGTISYPSAHDDYEADRATWSAGYDQIDRSTARDFREIAKVIWAQEQSSPLGGIAARYFRLSNGGYDTHSDQKANDPNGQHYGLHSEVGAALRHFFNDLASMSAGLENRVAVMIYSEFSRRIEQNDSGTDHGSQGPVFVVGGGVNGGIYGRHPNIGDTDGDGNTRYSQATSGPDSTFRSTDFRDVYGTIIKHWLSVDPTSFLPVDTVPSGGDPNDYWTVPNFDMVRPLSGVPLFKP